MTRPQSDRDSERTERYTFVADLPTDVLCTQLFPIELESHSCYLDGNIGTGTNVIDPTDDVNTIIDPQDGPNSPPEWPCKSTSGGRMILRSRSERCRDKAPWTRRAAYAHLDRCDDAEFTTLPDEAQANNCQWNNLTLAELRGHYPTIWQANISGPIDRTFHFYDTGDGARFVVMEDDDLTFWEGFAGEDVVPVFYPYGSTVNRHRIEIDGVVFLSDSIDPDSQVIVATAVPYATGSAQNVDLSEATISVQPVVTSKPNFLPITSELGSTCFGYGNDPARVIVDVDRGDGAGVFTVTLDWEAPGEYRGEYNDGTVDRVVAFNWTPDVFSGLRRINATISPGTGSPTVWSTPLDDTDLRANCDDESESVDCTQLTSYDFGSPTGGGLPAATFEVVALVGDLC